MKLLKFIAPKVMTVNGKPSPCECTDTITCAYCVQANLLLMEKKFKSDADTLKSIISFIRRNGIRKTSRQLAVNHNAVRYWIKTKNIPQNVVEKYAGCVNQ